MRKRWYFHSTAPKESDHDVLFAIVRGRFEKEHQLFALIRDLVFRVCFFPSWSYACPGGRVEEPFGALHAEQTAIRAEGQFMMVGGTLLKVCSC
jgi:hypothetical protein